MECNRYLKVIAFKFIVFTNIFQLEPSNIRIDFTLMISWRIYFNITIRNKHTQAFFFLNSYICEQSKLKSQLLFILRIASKQL